MFNLRRPPLVASEPTRAYSAITYLAFYEYDSKAKRRPQGLPCDYKLFASPRGFHAIGTRRISAKEKKIWFKLWNKCLPSDYLLRNWNWLRPCSLAELQFLLESIGDSQSQYCVYWKDDLYPMNLTMKSSGNGYRKHLIMNFLNGWNTLHEDNYRSSNGHYFRGAALDALESLDNDES